MFFRFAIISYTSFLMLHWLRCIIQYYSYLIRKLKFPIDIQIISRNFRFIRLLYLNSVRFRSTIYSVLYYLLLNQSRDLWDHEINYYTEDQKTKSYKTVFTFFRLVFEQNKVRRPPHLELTLSGVPRSMWFWEFLKVWNKSDPYEIRWTIPSETVFWILRRTRS